MSRPRAWTDLWLWEGATRYEGRLASVADGRFTAHLRSCGDPATRAGGGRRHATSVFSLQRYFVGRRFVAYASTLPGAELREAEILAVQVSRDIDFDVYVGGVIRDLDETQRELLRRMSVTSAAGLFGDLPPSARAG